jgi:D-alanyl-D-alanine carboxypeptidase
MATVTRLLALVLLALLALPAPAVAQRASGVPDPDRLQPLLDEVVRAGAPGAAMFARDAEGEWDGSSGMAAVGGRDLDPDDHFRVGSVTKTYVATAVLQLVEQRRLGLADTVEQRLPGLLPYGSRVTLRQLLDHTSGVPDYLAAAPLGDYWTHGPGSARAWRPRELVGLVAAAPPAFEPGSSWGYSNTNYVLLGLMIERVTGLPLGAELDRGILRPLGLDETTFPINEQEIPADRSQGYSAPLGPDGRPTAGALVDVTSFNPSITWGAGNMISSVEDVADFYSALLSGRLLSPELLAEMKRAVPTGVAGAGYGTGLVRAELPCGPAYGHTGGIFGFNTIALSSEDAGVQVVAFMNVFQPPSPAAADALQRAAVDAYCSAGEPRASVRPAPRLARVAAAAL